MQLFKTEGKDHKETHGFFTRLLNQSYSHLSTWSDGSRVEKRVNISLAVFVMPIVNGEPDVADAIATVTTNVSSRGLSIVMLEELEAKQLAIGINWEDRSMFFVADVRHQVPMGAGLWNVGTQLGQILYAGDHPNLDLLKF